MASESAVAAELDAAHERARRAYATRDLAAYIEIFHPDLEYRQPDGRTIGRDRLARDVRDQLDRVHFAASEFRRESLALGADGVSATEEGEQRATFEVRAFGVVRRIWSVRRRGRYEWVCGAAGWQIRRVDVLREEVTSRVAFGLGRNAPAA
jgi:hypothetical protein